jgi:hypothetical protein
MWKVHNACYAYTNTSLTAVGGIGKSGKDPRTREKEQWIRSSTEMTQEETKNLPKTAQTSEAVNPFTRALAPPFIGRWRDFYILKTPSISKNIPNVNVYMNVFYISYIYKPATSSHAKPGLFETTSLTLLLTGSWISPFRKSSRTVTSKLNLQHIPEFHRLPKFTRQTRTFWDDVFDFASYWFVNLPVQEIFAHCDFQT